MQKNCSMKTISKKLIFLLILFAILVSLILALDITKQEKTVYASTTPKYAVRFDYSFYNGSALVESKRNVTTSNFTLSAIKKAAIKFALYGTDYSIAATLDNGGAIKSSEINIEAESGFDDHEITVTNSNGINVGSSLNKTILLKSLSSGSYRVSVTAKSTVAQMGSSMFPTFYYYKTVCTFGFVVDTIAPIISGASTSITGKYTNSTFTVNASDTHSSTASLYIQAPNNSSYVLVGTSSKTVADGSVNGLYRFYAVDRVGNESSIYYVYYDNTIPIGLIRSGSGTTIDGNYTNTSFTFTATDSASGIAYLQYKTPTSLAWTNYTPGTSILENMTNGLYIFQAVDKCGNISIQRNMYLDTIKPTLTIYGGSKIIPSGGTTTASYLSFVGNDSSSGVKNIFVRISDSMSYAKYNGEQYIKDGTYYLYCEDNAGNISPTYVVTLDKTAPILNCSETEFFKTYGEGFTVTARDNGGNVKLYYKTPSTNTFSLTSSDSYIVGITDTNGKYYFYCEDLLGNRSSTVWVELMVKYPEAQIIRSDTENNVYITWDDNNYAVRLNGEPYTKGTVIRKEGEYNITVTNNKGLSSTYSFSIEHQYVMNLVPPTCAEQGYTINKCLSCENSFYSNFVAAFGHKYVESLITASCTEGGCRRNTCSECGDVYETDNVPALGHNYFEEVVIATCSESGCIKHTCNVCKYEYQTDIVSASGHGYISKVVTSSSCMKSGERNHACEKCGDSYSTEIPAIGHSYMITDVIIDEGESQRTYTCSICLDSYTQDLGNQYEHVTSYVEYLFNLYSPFMVWVFIGTAGVWSIFIGVSVVIAQKNEEKEKAKRMLINYGIGMVVIFAILIACPYLLRGIAILVS